MSGSVADLNAHRTGDHRHRLSHFAFRRGINVQAQAVLARLRCQLTSELDGVVACDLAFDRASGEWVEHIVWRADRAPSGHDTPPAEARAIMAKLRAKDCLACGL